MAKDLILTKPSKLLEKEILMYKQEHFSYGIRPSERGKGYGKQQLELALNHAKSLGMREVIIACDKSNIASAMTAKSCGGILSNEFVEDGVIKQHYSIDLR